MATIVKCPACRRAVEWSESSPYRPFCSDRCRLTDLGAWLTEKHKIPDDVAGDGEDVLDDHTDDA